MKGILGKKIGMTRIFDEKGKAVPVTVIEAGPCVVTQIKTEDKDGYKAVQLGFGESKKLNKPISGQLKKIGKEVKSKYLREIKDGAGLKVGDIVDVSILKEDEVVSITGVTKGKGFAGTIKRHGFHRGPKTHGSHNIRQPGSIGSMYPEHVFKGMKMAGRMGQDQLTINDLKVIKVDKENNLLAVKGSIPGPSKGLLVIRSEGVKAEEKEEQPEPGIEKEEEEKKEVSDSSTLLGVNKESEIKDKGIEKEESAKEEVPKEETHKVETENING